jgi:hypothetical protein
MIHGWIIGVYLTESLIQQLTNVYFILEIKL